MVVGVGGEVFLGMRFGGRMLALMLVLLLQTNVFLECHMVKIVIYEFSLVLCL